MQSNNNIIADYVAKAKKGDKEAFVWLYQNNINKVYYICLKFLRNEEDAKDVAQETFVTAMEKIDTIQSPEYFVTWINHIAVNKCKNILAKNEKMKFEESEEFNFEEDVQEYNVEFIPEEYIESKEKRDIIMDIIDNKLSDVQRMVIILYYYEGLTVADIANVMECSEATVKSRMFLARNIIKKSIEEKEEKGICIRSVAPIFILSQIFAEDAKANVLPNGLYDVMLEEIKNHLMKRTTNMVKKSLGLKIAGSIAGVTAAVGIGVGAMFLVGNSDERNETSKQTTYYESSSEDNTEDSVLGEVESTTKEEAKTDMSEDEVIQYIIDNNGKLPEGVMEDDYFPYAGRVVDIILKGFMNLDAGAIRPFLKEKDAISYANTFERIKNHEESRLLWEKTVGEIKNYKAATIVRDLEYVYMSWYTDYYVNNKQLPVSDEKELTKAQIWEIYENHYTAAPYSAYMGFGVDYEEKDGYIRFDVFELLEKYGYCDMQELFTHLEMMFNYPGVIFGDIDSVFDYESWPETEEGKQLVDYFLDKDIDSIVEWTVDVVNNSDKKLVVDVIWDKFVKYYINEENRNIIKDFLKECNVLYGNNKISIYYPINYSVEPLADLNEEDRAALESDNVKVVEKTSTHLKTDELGFDVTILTNLVDSMIEMGLLE